jgi:hypothetical protein
LAKNPKFLNLYEEGGLKVKKKSLLVVIAILSVFLCGIGTSYAIWGVADDVPGQDLVWPVLCAQTPGPNPALNNSALTSLNTNWAIADLVGGTTDLSGITVTANCSLWSAKSTLIFDFTYSWTPFQVVVDDCQSLLTRHPNAKLVDLNGDTVPDLQQTISGDKYWAGYITCTQSAVTPVGYQSPNPIVDRFMNNVYLVDLPLGFASGFNGPSLEGTGSLSGTLPSDSLMGELGSNYHITAGDVFARYYINNDPLTNPNTWDWWIFLLGRNQYNLTDNITSTRILNGDICDENEHCQSLSVPIPWELNVIDVDPLLPGSPFFTPLGNHSSSVAQTFPKAGFASLTVTESGSLAGEGAFHIIGTVNNLEGPTSITSSFYSLFGWSYERAQASTALADFDVIHPIFRTYCSGGVAGAGGLDNFSSCSCTNAAGADCSVD